MKMAVKVESSIFCTLFFPLFSKIRIDKTVPRASKKDRARRAASNDRHLLGTKRFTFRDNHPGMAENEHFLAKIGYFVADSSSTPAGISRGSRHKSTEHAPNGCPF